jgi:hypothetical protein
MIPFRIDDYKPLQMPSGKGVASFWLIIPGVGKLECLLLRDADSDSIVLTGPCARNRWRWLKKFFFEPELEAAVLAEALALVEAERAKWETIAS